MDSSPLITPSLPLPLNMLSALPSRAGLEKAGDREAAVMFEGMLMMQMLQAMRKTVEPSGLFGDESESRSTYEYLLDQALVEHAMASGKALGLADRLEKILTEARLDPSALS